MGAAAGAGVGVNEREAAEKIAALLNEIQAAGLQVSVSERSDRGALEVGDWFSVVEPFFDDQPWEATEDR